jgi:putative nucleotidyltransferase with HDIG domain
MMIESAHGIAESLLANDLPRRWAHTGGVATRATELADLMGDEAGLLHAAALLHDIGYAPQLAATGFHPLDGARYLRKTAVFDERLVSLVAHHSFALVEAELRGLRTELESEFPQRSEDRLLTDALLFCDMTTTPNGTRTTSWARVDEITSRYGADSLVGRFIRLAAPGIHATVERVQARAAAGGIPL